MPSKPAAESPRPGQELEALQATVARLERELEIEASLEQVRARAIAMKTSAEMLEVADILFRELRSLGDGLEANLWGCGFVICKPDCDDDEVWFANQFGILPAIVMPHTDDPTHRKMYEGWQNGSDLFSEFKEGTELKAHYDYMLTVPSVRPIFEEILASGLSFPTWQKWHAAYFSHGYLLIITTVPYENEHIFTRFARVFDQTYTRFLDLQKAEAQAREAQIEAALEKVRSRSLAMHRSEELLEVVKTVFERLKELNLPIDAAAIFIFKEDLIEYWFAAAESEYLTPKHLPHRGNAIVDGITNARQAKQSSFSLQLTYAEKNKFFHDIFKLTDFSSIPDERKKFLLECKAMAVSVAIEKNSGIQLNNYSGRILSEQDNEVLQRFGRVFEQAYIRFLDLERAETQAREAQVEAALDRVRATSMAMHRTEELQEVVRVVAGELKKLGVVLDVGGAVICTYFEDSKDVIHWTASEDPKHPSVPYLLPYFEDTLFDEAWESKNRGDVYYAKKFSHQVYSAFWRKAFECSDYAKLPEAYKRTLLESPNQAVAWAWSKNSAIMIPSLEGILPSENDKDILIRFARVFEQAFIRFLDLQKAEAQAREAKIEAALERVRASTMAMHRSEQLPETAKILFQQFHELGKVPDRISIGIINEAKEVIELWVTDQSGTEIGHHFDFPFTETSSVQPLYRGWKAKKSSIVIDLQGETLKKWIRFVREEVHMEIDETHIRGRRVHHGAFFSRGFLLITTHQPIEAELMELLKRFAKVFDQTYTRFLDLQKAEAQAREARIEAALERVRARTMAMHKSAELQDVINTVYQQFLQLEVEITGGAFIAINSEIDSELVCWGAGGTADYIEEVHLPFMDMPIYTELVERIKMGPGFFTESFSQEEKQLFFKELFRIPPYNKATEGRKKEVMSRPGGYTRSCKVSPYTSIFIINHHGRPFSAEENDILMRMGKVFEQTYTRFLDLQKAEAQAREAQIEAALEKVRSQSLAMHSTSEMQLVANEVGNQLRGLGLQLDAVGMSGTIHLEEGYDVWLGGADATKPLRIPFNDDTQVQREYNEVLKNRSPLFAKTFSGEVKKEYIDKLLSHGEFPEELKNKMINATAFSTSLAPTKNSGIQIVRYTPEPFTEVENEILQRFAKVFEQAYIRFMDLEKAEAQARESQIEAALERVRARSMAMHQSEELGEVASVMFEQLSTLTKTPDRFNIGIINEEEASIDIWVTDQNGHEVNQLFVAEAAKSPVISAFFEARNTKKSFAVDLHGKELKDWVQYMNKEVGIPFKEEQLKEHRYINSVYFSHGFIGVTTDEPLAEETVGLIGRFAKVFQQTYVRFLDLQKAEAQAREARIEAALEKVRSASMAMHQTEDIGAVVVVFFDQLKQLHIPFEQAWITIFRLEEGYFDTWFSPIDEIYPNPTHFKMPSGPWEETSIKSWKSGAPFSYMSLGTKEEVNQFLEACDEITDSKYFTHAQKTLKNDRLEFLEARHKYGFISKTSREKPTREDEEILQRFAKVFEQTYTRFSDIEKAEAQARESEIQLALERVRARSMAMHHSSELNSVLAKVFQELTSLGLEMERAVIWTYYPENRSVRWWAANPEAESGSESFYIANQDDPVYDEYWRAWEERRTKYLYILEGDYKENWTEILFNKTELGRLPDVVKEAMVRPEKIYLYNTFNDFGVLFISCLEPLPEEKFSILERFGKVFDQSYTRFQDIQKAEAQAREAEVQLALERVRAATMAMHASQELSEVAAVLFQQMNELGVTPERVNIGIVQEHERLIEYWSTEQGGKKLDRLIKGSIDEPTTLSKVYAGWKAGQSTLEIHQTGKELAQWIRYLKEVLAMPFDEQLRQERRVQTSAFFKHGMLLISTPQPVSDETKTLLHRFAGVFEQTYTRFLDLQRAEAQAREAQIEAALERVRAKTMAMHNTEDIGATVITFFEELVGLGLDDSMRIGIGILSQSEQMKFWTATINETSQTILQTGFLDMSKHPLLVGAKNAWAQGASHFNHRLEGEDVKIYFQTLNDAPEVPAEFDLNKLPPTVHHQSYVFGDGILYSFTDAAIPEDISNIMERFAAVFGQTYTRYLDLQKAEQRAQEAQIEAALERVRAKTMAMHNTEDIGATVATFFRELVGLGLDATIRCGVGILSQSEHMQLWTASATDASAPVLHTGTLDMTLHPLLKSVRKTWAAKEKTFAYTLKGNDLKRYYQVLNEAPDYPAHFDLKAIPKMVYHNSFAFRDGMLFVFTETPLHDDIRNILERFAAVFGQTYTRYLDLKKAEERAREAQIEAALERVRARSMAMHKSDELLDLSVVLFQELDKLGVSDFFNCGFVEVDEEAGKQSGWTTMTDGSLGEGYYLPLRGDKVLDARYRAWKKSVPSLCQKVSGRELENHMAFALPTLGSERVREMAATFPDPTYFYCFNFSHGYLSIISGEVLRNEAEAILIKFTRAFEQAYIRFTDLQKSEAQAQEATRQASIERVRGEIASMRSTADLERITPLIWNELTALGVPFIRCGVFIIHEPTESIQAYLSAPDGHALGVMNLDFEAGETTRETVAHWRKKEAYQPQWTAEEFTLWTESLLQEGKIKDRKTYQDTERPPEMLYLNFIPFAQGMLYVGNTGPLEAEALALIQSLAEAFSFAYARYEDFNQLEQALSELKATQAQLIQSEKMASLGELTAGIAHEIKNPLNFVNNFSEVSRELLEELLEELEKGDLEEVKALASDVSDNLEKIVHHGMRADGIVKGMLQHSRSGDGKKEPTDLNALADEYLRLAYHGLRAKDKSFNATLNTDFDPAIGMVELIPQDLGRVILNLLTNAFYAVSEKARAGQNGYMPTVSIQTAREGGQVLVSVTDNGNGIPDGVREKIFQPFFTTKPTGEGTGLGLSMSYDIVTKGHGGTLEVKTASGVGTTFVIKLNTTP